MDIVVTRDEYSAPFFDGCARGRLLLRHCEGCGTFAAPEIRDCPRCGSSLVWRPAAGSGTLLTWSSVGASGDGTAVLAAIIELDEGPWLHARAVVHQVDPGLRVVVGFDRPNSGGRGEWVPVFVDSPGTSISA